MVVAGTARRRSSPVVGGLPGTPAVAAEGSNRPVLEADLSIKPTRDVGQT